MNLDEINNLVLSERFQEAIIEYDSSIFNYPELANNLFISRDNTRRRLVQKLSSNAKLAIKNIQSGIESTANEIPNVSLLKFCYDSQVSQLPGSLQWYRLDFVVETTAISKKILVTIPILKNSSNPISLSSMFNVSEMTSIFIAFYAGACIENFSQGIEFFDSNVIAFSICKLTDDQVVEQIIATQFNSSDSSHVLSILNEFNTNPVIPKKCITTYLSNYSSKYFEGIDKTDVATRRYLFRIHSFLKNAVSSYLKLSKTLECDVDFPEDILNTVQYKNQLNSNIDFNIEGFKILTTALILHGWIIDPNKILYSIRISHAEYDGSFEFLPQLIKFERPDVVAHSGVASATIDTHFGFASVIDGSLVFNKKFADGWTLHCTTIDGNNYSELVSLHCLPSSIDGLSRVSNILPNQTTHFDLCRYLLKPVFDAYRKAKQKNSEGYYHTFDFKPTNEISTLSIIIPLYGKTRFELTQIPVLAALQRPDWEVIFAVDDPSILEEVKGNIYRLALLYGMSISIVAPSENLGFAGINNLATNYANSNVVLFLNSDCFLTNKVAIELGLAWIDSSNDNGAVGFRLTYADCTIQHDGMSLMKWKNDPAFYLNDHPRQGFDEDLIPDIIKNDIAILLTAACLMMKKSLFKDINGFDCQYFKGDFEDSDLCLKIINSSKKLGIIRQPGLFHLERQSISSIDSLLRERITMTNSSTYTERWREVLSGELPTLEVIT